MILWAGTLSALNQWIWKPFTKLAPGKLFKGIGNATRIFSKKKGFDFQSYDTHETGKDTWVNQIKEKRIWFFGWGSSEKKKTNENPVEEKQPEIKKEPVVSQNTEPKKEEKPATKPEEKKVDTPAEKKTEETKAPLEMSKEDPHAESAMLQQKIKEKDDAFIDKELAERGYGPGGELAETPKKEQSKEKATSIADIEKQRKAEAFAKDQAEIEAKKRKNMPKDEKEKLRKEFAKLLDNRITEEWVIAWGKKYNKGNNMEEILKRVDKENVTFATFIDDEILAKKAPEKAAA